MESGGACTQRRTAERMRLRFAPPEDQRAGRPFAPRSRLIAHGDSPAGSRPVGALVCGASGRLDEGESEAPNKIRFRPALGRRVGSAKQNAECRATLSRTARSEIAPRAPILIALLRQTLMAYAHRDQKQDANSGKHRRRIPEEVHPSGCGDKLCNFILKSGHGSHHWSTCN